MEAQQANDHSAYEELLLDTIAKNIANSPHEIFQKMNHAVNDAGDGSKLDAKALTGGLNNLSFKVFVDKQPELVVFTKLCFDYQAFNPEAAADLKRCENELEVMKMVSRDSPDCVVAPLACWDIEQGGKRMKMLVTGWSKADEQFVNQFLDGAVDPRIAPKIAKTLWTLHNVKEFDPDFNADANEGHLYDGFTQFVQDLCNKKNPGDRTEAYCAGVGEDALVKPLKIMLEGFFKRECLIHNDTHVFNILVEAKPSVEQLEKFAPEGSVSIIDWELSLVGQPSKDLGMLLCFPIGCMLSHALNGNLEAKESIRSYVNSLLDTYLSRMCDAGKSSEEIADLLRSSFAWCGLHQCTWMYGMRDIFKDTHAAFPVESEEQRQRICDAMGVMGFKVIRFCDEDFLSADSSPEEIREMFDSSLEEEVALFSDAFASREVKTQRRKSSMLRSADRRISTSGLVAQSMRSLSVADADNE